MTKWTVLPNPDGPALVVPAWASDATKQLGSEVAELFDATRAARAEVERMKAEAGTIDLMVTSIADLTGAAATARQSQLECLRTEITARSKFAEFLVMLESDRARVERESLTMIEAARADAKQRLLDSGVPDLSAAVVNRGGSLAPDHETQGAFARIICSFQPVVEAATLHREARSMATALTERIQSNRRHREEAESALRSMLSALAAVAVA